MHLLKLRGGASLIGLILMLFASACRNETDAYPEIEFNDSAETNTRVTGAELGSLKFQDKSGNTISLDQYKGKKCVVLVITRGFVGSADPEANGRGSFCTYCSTQTARLIANYKEFRKRDAEILLVFPVLRSEDAVQADTFAAKAQPTAMDPRNSIPFPLVVDLELAAVDELGIRDDLSKPATYILDKNGDVRFAYVGQSLSDRPSVKAMLDQLDLIQQADGS